MLSNKNDLAKDWIEIDNIDEVTAHTQGGSIRADKHTNFEARQT